MRTQCKDCEKTFESEQAWNEHDCPNFDAEAFNKLPLALMRKVATEELTLEQALAKM